MQFPIVIGLHRSTLLFFLLVLFHAVAVACLMVLPWPLSVRLFLLVPVGWSLVYALRPPRIIGLRLSSRGALDCLLADGRRIAAKVLPDSTVFARLIVLRLRLCEENRVSRLVVLPDQISAEQFRLLRLCLRWQVPPTDGDESVS